mmetsp:Transcript_24572/g.52338  ORF Transcript_24572/g.52338 Transcript_24572/m.52338 type:complete len:253 (-) Transcript_24572:53-811(-)
MQKDGISVFALVHNLLVGFNHVFSRWFIMDSVIHQDYNVFFFKPMNVHKVFFHVQDIVVASPQLSVLANIIDSYHDGTTDSGRSVGNEFKVRLDVDLVEGRQLWNLSIPFLAQILPHELEDLRETQCVFRNVLILVQNPQEGRCAGTPRTPGRIGELEVHDVENIGRGLGILAPRDHSDVLSAHRVWLFVFKLVLGFFLVADEPAAVGTNRITDCFFDLFSDVLTEFLEKAAHFLVLVFVGREWNGLLPNSH